jgi:uncharacterized protein (DUF2062 family)
MKYIKDRVRSLFRLNDSPHRLATAFALGIFIAFSPILGFHTISCLLLAWAFRLSKIVVLTAAFMNNPWTIVPIYGSCLWIGMKITGSGSAIPHIAWSELNLTSAYMILKPYLWPFVAGTLIVGVIAAAASYGVVYWAVMRYRKTEDGAYSSAHRRKATET